MMFITILVCAFAWWLLGKDGVIILGIALILNGQYPGAFDIIIQYIESSPFQFITGIAVANILYGFFHSLMHDERNTKQVESLK